MSSGTMASRVSAPAAEMSDARKRLPRAERRQQILESARAVFLSRSPAATRMSDIADAAGVNVALLYQHFRSKTELYEAAVVLPLERLVENLEAGTVEMPAPGSGEAQRAVTTQVLGRVLAIFSESMQLFGSVLFGDPELATAFYRRRLEPLIESVVGVVDHHEAAWPHRSYDPVYVTKAFLGMCWFLAMDAHFTGQPLDIEEATAELSSLLFQGLAPP